MRNIDLVREALDDYLVEKEGRDIEEFMEGQWNENSNEEKEGG